MREDPTRTGTSRWDWYGKGDESTVLRPARGMAIQREDNSQDRVLFEIGLTVLCLLLCATVVEIVLVWPT
jgi:hypothetical protein